MYNDKRFLVVFALTAGAVCGYLHAAVRPEAPAKPVTSNATSEWNAAWKTATATNNSSNLVSVFKAAAANAETPAALSAWNSALDQLDPFILRTATTGQQDLVFGFLDTDQGGNIKAILGDSVSLKYEAAAYKAVKDKIQKMSTAGWAFTKVAAKSAAFTTVPQKPNLRSRSH